MTNRGSVLAVIACAGLALWCFLEVVRRSKETTEIVPPRFEGTTQIEFTVYTGPRMDERVWTITKPEEVAELVQAIQLVPKRPCACAHTDFARFVTATEKIEVSFCDHCFDVIGRKRGNYAMPTNFYAKIRRSAPAAFRDDLHEPPPAAPVPVAK